VSQHTSAGNIYCRTLDDVLLNGMFTFKRRTAKETAELSVVRVNCLMTFQFTCCTVTLWTLIAKLLLHTLMSLHVWLKVMFGAEYHLTNVTCEPSAFVVW